MEAAFARSGAESNSDRKERPANIRFEDNARKKAGLFRRRASHQGKGGLRPGPISGSAAMEVLLRADYNFYISRMNTIEQYRAAKADVIKLETQVKKELLALFRQRESELVQIQKELRELGVKVSINLKAKRPTRKAAAPAAAEPAAAEMPDPKVRRLERSLLAQKKKLEEAKGMGKPEKPIKDRIYELEDELRLAKEA